MAFGNRPIRSARESADFAPAAGRIEPNFGATDAALDEIQPVAKSGQYQRPARAPETEMADVLMATSGPSWRQRDAEVQRPSEPRTIDQDLPVGTVNASPSTRVRGASSRRSRFAKREVGYSKVSPQGERRAAPHTRKSASSWWHRSYSKWLLLIFVAAVLGALYWARTPLGELMERPFKSVVVEGTFHFISKEHATELIGSEIDNNFLRLDLQRLKLALMTDPWVESVSLSRRWPDTLVVKINEQKPIARWGKGFLNQRGQIVDLDSAERLAGLPWLEGNSKDALEILQQYQDFSQLLRPRGLDVIALKCDDKKSWRLTLKNNVEIVLGRNQVMEKMRRFVTVYDSYLNAIWGDVKAIDVRYTNGVAVRWIEGSESAKKYLQNRSAATSALSPAASGSPN